ncbi:MAG: hypothetical protein AAGC55_18535, partial [Myxococcota bacterium]
MSSAGPSLPTAREVVYGASLIHQVHVGGFAISESRYQPDFQIPTHYHERPCLTYVLNGGFIEKTRSSELTISANRLLVKPAATVHSDSIAPCGAHSVQIELIEDDAELVPMLAHFDRPVVRKTIAVARIVNDIVCELNAPDHLSPLALSSLVM